MTAAAAAPLAYAARHAGRVANDNEPIIVDLFAGGGGASEAIFRVTGRHPDVAVNHDKNAIDIHTVNHPLTKHYRCDVREVDPVEACTVNGVLRKLGLLWASPDCTHFSKARGGKPVSKGIRSLADVVLVWAEKVRPTIIALENVEEFKDWGPVLENGKPCPENKGLDFRRWVKALRDMGYVVEWRELVAADFGAPTTRKRLFLVARCDGLPISWPTPTHASRKQLAKNDLFDMGLQLWRSAAEDVIDWSIEIPSIWDRRKPLAEKTLARIAKGIKRFIIDSPSPFIVPVTHSGPGRVHDLEEPSRTVTSANRGEFSLVAPTLTQRYGEREGQEPRALDVQAPHPTVVPDGNGAQLAAAMLQKMNQNGIGTPMTDPLVTAMAGAPRHYSVAAYLSRQFGSTVSGRDAEEPHPTVMTEGGGGKTQLAAAYMAQGNGDRVGRAGEEPVTTLTGRSTQQQLIAAALVKYFGTGIAKEVFEPADTITTKARFGLSGAYLEQANTGMVGHDAREPVSTIVGKGSTQRLVDVALDAIGAPAGSRRRLVLEFLWAHFGVPSDDQWADPMATAEGRLRFGLVVLDGQVFQIVDIGMRMLTPRELFNAQGFPNWSRKFILAPWEGQPQQSKITPAKHAEPASGESASPVPFEPARVTAQIDLEHGVLRLLRTGKSPSSAPSAEASVESPLPTEIARAAHGLAPRSTGGVSGRGHGKAVSLQSVRPSTPAEPGATSATSSGAAIRLRVGAAATGTSTASESSKFTTLPDGLDSPISVSTLETLFSYVADVIASSTLGEMSAGNSFVELEVRDAYIIDQTLDGRPITKTAQTRMAGNSVSPPPAAALLAVNLPHDMLLREAA